MSTRPGATTHPSASSTSAPAPATATPAPGNGTLPPTVGPTPTQQPAPTATPVPTATSAAPPSNVVTATGGPGIIGTATAGPVCPVERYPPDPACAPRPVAGATITVHGGGGQVIATATLGATFGFGGLGRFIVLGDANQDNGELFGGVVLVAALALTTFGLFLLIERRLVSAGLSRGATG